MYLCTLKNNLILLIFTKIKSMKTRKLLVFATIISLFFAGCKKDEPIEKPEPTPDPTPTEAEANTLIINGTTYHLQSKLSIDQNGRGYADAQTTELDAEENPLYSIIADVEPGSMNGTYDLTEFTSDYYFNVHNYDDTYGVGQDYHHDTGVSGWIGDEEHPSGIFTSGTLTITKTEDLFTYKLNGTLVNGQTLSFHISVPAAEWEYLEW